MRDEIRPALTPEQWRDLGDPGFLRSAVARACDAVASDVGWSPAALMALANAARDDEGKITLDDVHDILAAATAVALTAEEGGPSDEGRAGGRDRAARVRRAGAKLAALLPQRESTT